MGTDSVDDVVNDSTVFVDGDSNNKERLLNGSTTNPAMVLTHKLEKKLRTSKTSSSKSPVGINEVELDHPELSEPPKLSLLPPNRLFVPAKTVSDQPLIAYDIDSDEEIQFVRSSKPKLLSGKEATSRLLADDFDIELRSDEDEGDTLDLIRPQPIQPRCICCKVTCTIQ